MNNDKEALQYIIEKSFLPEKQKKELLEYVETKKPGEEFFALFEKYILAEVNRRQALYQDAETDLKQLIAELDKKVAERKQHLDDILRTKISELPDTEHQAEIAKYEEALKSLENQYVQKLQNFIQQIKASLKSGEV